MEISQFWPSVARLVAGNSPEWPSEGLPEGYGDRYGLISAYFALVYALSTQDEPRLEAAVEGFLEAAGKVPLDFLVPYYKQAYLSVPQPHRASFWPFLDDVIGSLFAADMQSDLIDLLEELAPEIWWDQIPHSLRKIHKKTKALDVRLLVMLIRHSAEHPQGRFPGGLWGRLTDLIGQSPYVWRPVISLAYHHPEQCQLDAADLERLAFHEQADAKSLYYLSELWWAQDEKNQAAEWAWKAFCLGELPLEILEYIFMVLWEAGRWKLAGRVAEALLETNLPAETLVSLANALLAMDDFQQAEKALLRAVKDRDAPGRDVWQEAQLALLQAATVKGTRQDFLRQYGLVKEFLKELLPFHLDLVGRLVDEREYDAALSEFGDYSLLESSGDREQAFLLYALACEGKGGLSEALVALEHGVEALGPSPVIMQALLGFWWRHARYLHVLRYLEGYSPPTPELAALALIAYAETDYRQRAISTFSEPILSIEDRRLRNHALKAYIDCLAREGQWGQVSATIAELPAEILETQWGRFHLQFSLLVEMINDPDQDPASIALAFERLLSLPLSTIQLRSLARWLRQLFEKRPQLAETWRFRDIHDYILLHVADLVERHLELARKTPAVSEREVGELNQSLSELQLDATWRVLDDLDKMLRRTRDDSLDH